VVRLLNGSNHLAMVSSLLLYFLLLYFFNSTFGCLLNFRKLIAPQISQIKQIMNPMVKKFLSDIAQITEQHATQVLTVALVA